MKYLVRIGFAEKHIVFIPGTKLVSTKSHHAAGSDMASAAESFQGIAGVLDARCGLDAVVRRAVDATINSMHQRVMPTIVLIEYGHRTKRIAFRCKRHFNWIGNTC